MKQSDVLYYISDFERKTGIKKDIYFRGNSLWPLFRVAIVSEVLALRKNKPPPLSCRDNLILKIKQQWSHLAIPFFFFILNIRYRFAHAENLYMENPANRKKILVGSLRGDPFLLSLRCLILSLNSRMDSLHMGGAIYKLASQYFLSSVRKEERHLLKSSRELIRLISSFFQMEEDRARYIIQSHICAFLARYYFFKNIFKKTKYRNIFYAVYYFPDIMALNLVASEKKIKTIEIQHGQQGKNSPFYIFHNMPVEGYKILPKVFWIWGERGLKYKKFLTETEYHQYVVAGHVVLNRERPHIEMAKEKEKNMILFAGQVSFDIDEIVPHFVRDALFGLQKKGCNVVIRLHPYTLAHVDRIETFFRSHGISVLQPSHEPLYEQLKRVSWLITLWSSVAYEAKCFGSKVIITSPIGYDHMQEDIASGAFSYAQSTEEILRIIEEDNDQKEIDDFIEMSDKKIIENLRSGLGP